MRIGLRELALGLVLVLSGSPMLPAAAQDWYEEEEEESRGFLGDYRATVGNRFLVGVNSIATFPADPVMSTVLPREEFDELPGAVVSKYPIGLTQGVLLCVYRGVAGIFDVALSPITPFTMLSPEPRYTIIRGLEHEEY